MAVVLSVMLLSGAVAAAVSAAIVRLAYDEPPAIASVRLGEITAAYAVKAAESDASPDATAAHARRWAAALETALDRVAKYRDVVLLPARAVAAGAPDVTGEVEAVLAGLLAHSRPEGNVAPPGETP